MLASPGTSASLQTFSTCARSLPTRSKTSVGVVEMSSTRSRRYLVASTSSINTSQNSSDFVKSLLKLTQMSLSAQAELPPGRYWVTVEYQSFEGRSPPESLFPTKSSQPSTPPTSSK